MIQKTLQKLEYTKIIEILAARASSDAGAALCRSLQPMTDLDAINTAQEETACAFTRLVKKGSIFFYGAWPVETSLKRLEIGGVIGAGELLKIKRLLAVTAHVKSYGRHDNNDDSRDILDGLFDLLAPLTPLSAEIDRCILGEDEISDDASPALRSIRNSMHRINDRIHDTLNQLVNGKYSKYLQDTLITMRGDRYCIPVKAEYRNQVPGMIHDQSQTGSTLFIEPMAVVNLNNDLKELYAKENDEIQKILADLSSLAAEHISEIRTDAQTLARLDFIFAKGQLALDWNATIPIFNQERRIHIREGRHPLLDPQKVVPITVRLGRDFDLLIITGPNTGGKTVSLKTVGLFTLIGQAGLHIPAQDRSELAVFTEVYADIGDEQSIEQSLSTFSSHMTNIVSFLENVDEHSLVLFDELGAGTDPVEGAALATAILEYLHTRGIRCVATTHYSELKVYALTTPGVENASCEFDVATLRPTYRLLIGVPGKSNAFAIAGKLGLPDTIIKEAQKHIDEQDVSFEDVLTNLEHSRKELEANQRKNDALQLELAQRQKELDRQERQLNDRRDKSIRKASDEAREILTKAKDEADEIVKTMRKKGTESISMAEMEREREKLRQQLAGLDKHTEKSAVRPAKEHKPQDFKLGESVLVLSMNVKGHVIALPDAKGKVGVQMGILKSKLPMSDLELIDEEPLYLKKQKSQSRKGGAMKMGKSFSVSPEINLLGKTVDEAVAELDKYLDDAYLAHLSQVRIVHGKGTGALRAGIHKYLKKQKNIKSFRLGEFGEGDAGVTIVEFK